MLIKTVSEIVKKISLIYKIMPLVLIFPVIFVKKLGKFYKVGEIYYKILWVIYVVVRILLTIVKVWIIIQVKLKLLNISLYN